jgi:hypothetical protein
MNNNLQATKKELSLVKTLSFKEYRFLNREYFWWSLFVSDNFFTYFTLYLLFVLPLDFLLKIGCLLLVIVQFLCLFFLSIKVTTNIAIYQSWQGKKIAKNNKKLQAIHAKLDELRESMVFDEEEGKEYWKILLLLDKI